ncbi:MAG: endonuclease III [Bacteroidales bacterium]|nr:endonuclease III [Bacteroidales bacterium]
MEIKERYDAVLALLAAAMPDARSELNFSNDYELMVAVMLSAQCTDKRVNMVTPHLFDRWPTMEALSMATAEEVYSVIKSVSYPNTKSRHLVAMARMTMEEFGGKLPTTREELMRLPGVGRKTANVILIEACGQEAMPVDTHVHRVAERIGLTQGCKTPEQTERQLLEHIPQEILHRAHHWLVLFGRYTCKALKPQCRDCYISHLCARMHPETVEDENGCPIE